MDPFETERLLVRQLVPSDATDFFLFNSNETVMRYIRPIKSRQESDAFLAENFNLYVDGFPYGRMYVADKINEKFVGTFSLLYLDGEADYHIGYACMPDCWGQGYATELVRHGSRIFFERTSHQRLFAITEPENHASAAVLRKCGFAQTGTYQLSEKALCLFQLTRMGFVAK